MLEAVANLGFAVVVPSTSRLKIPSSMERRYQTSRALAASNEESGSNSAAPSQSLGCRCLDQCRELGHGSCKDADTCRFGHDCEVATSSYSHQQILNSASPGKLLYHSDAVVPQKPGQPYWLENGAQEQKSETVSMGWNNSNVCSEHSTSVTISEAAVEHAQADISQAPSMAGLATQNQLPSNLNCYRTCHDPQYEARPPYSLIADALHKLDDDRARATGRMDTPDLYTHFHHQSCGSAVAMTGAQSSEGQATNGCQVADRRPFHTGGNIPLSDPAPRTPNRVRKASRHQVSESVTRNIQLDLARNYGIRHLGSLSDPVPYVRSPSSLSYYSSCDSITWTSSSPGRSSHPSSNGGHDSIAHATNLVVDLRSVIEAHSRWLDVLCPERSSSFYLRREAISTGQHGKLTSNWCDQLDKTSIPSAICRNCHVASGASSINATANIQKEHATAFMGRFGLVVVNRPSLRLTES